MISGYYRSLNRLSTGCSFSTGVRRVLAHVDHFVTTQGGDLTSDSFAGWCLTLQHLASGTRRSRMRIVRNFCLYRRRGELASFLPDALLFPPRHQVVRPHLFTNAEVVRLLAAISALPAAPTSPFRREKPASGDRAPVHRRFEARGASNRSTTSRAGEVTTPVRITHPFHPLFGQEIAFVERRVRTRRSPPVT